MRMEHGLRVARYGLVAVVATCLSTFCVGEFPRNGSSCEECHSSPFALGSSHISVRRSANFKAGRYVPSTEGGIQHRIGAAHQSELSSESLTGDRVTLSLIGDAYIEAIDPRDIARNVKAERAGDAGVQGIQSFAPVLESAAGKPLMQPGRFGWKGQHASLFSACADSMRNELGIRNRLYPEEYSTHDPATAPTPFDTPQTSGRTKLEEIVEQVRHLPPPARDEQLAASHDAQQGEALFSSLGCALCHVPTYKTLKAGSSVNGGVYRVPEYLGEKTIHPFSDFLLHDVGTGDGIPQAAKPEYLDAATADRFRTPPLWGLRFRSWMMHDGKAVTYHQAIMRHAGEATKVRARYEALSPEEKQQLRTFLNSL